MARTDANVRKKKRGAVRRIILALFALIIIAGAYLFFTYGSLPYAVITAKNLNSSTLISIMTQKVNSAAIVNLSYSGSIVINNTDPQFNFSYSKNGSQSWSDLKLMGVPNVEDLEATTYLNQTSGNGRGCVIYNFDNQNGTATSICNDSAYPYSAYKIVLGYLFNLTSIDDVNTTHYGLGSFDGQPCYLVSGIGTVMVNGEIFNRTGYVPSIFLFDTCLSARYNVPVYANVTILPSDEFDYALAYGLNNVDSISFKMTNSDMVLRGS
jgi:hypothetical protein